jgi:protein involved in polysaccharide export with SLBB domain
MKIAYWTAAIVCLVAVLTVTPGFCQTQPVDLTNGMANNTPDGMRLLLPYQSYAQYALDMVLRYQSGFIGSAVDPDEYVVGPGDRFTVSFVAGDIGDIGCQVGFSGKAFMKSVGSVDLTGKTLRESLEAMRQAVAARYKGSEFVVQMTGFRFIPVHVIGEVTAPGIYYAPALWRVSEVIDLAGGLTPEALSRKIILRGGGKTLPVDLVRFRAVGDKAANPMVCTGNTIVVPNRKACAEFVTVAGQVNRPGVFAAVSGDRVADYLTYAGGVAGSLTDMMISISNPGGGTTLTLDGADKATADHLPQPGDNITVAWREGAARYGDVMIFGAVASPGRYPITDTDFTFSDLLRRCGGFDENGCPDMIQVYRLNQNMTATQAPFRTYNQRMVWTDENVPETLRTRLSLDPRHPADLSELKAMDGDSVFVPFATGMITVSGAVASPGLVHYRKGESVGYYLKAAGGLGFDADKGRMVVLNPATGGEISANTAGRLFDGEVLYVPRKEKNNKP